MSVGALRPCFLDLSIIAKVTQVTFIGKMKEIVKRIFVRIVDNETGEILYEGKKDDCMRRARMPYFDLVVTRLLALVAAGRNVSISADLVDIPVVTESDLFDDIWSDVHLKVPY